ncbi:hypothetical protein NMG60_11007364 [Bertholletia excelsa]
MCLLTVDEEACIYKSSSSSSSRRPRIVSLLHKPRKEATMSIEALAMAGLDCMECEIDLMAWERPPPYLLEENDSSNYDVVEKNPEVDPLHRDQLVREKIRQWAKTVVSMNTEKPTLFSLQN